MERSGSRISRVAPKNKEPAERGDEGDSLRLYTTIFSTFWILSKSCPWKIRVQGLIELDI